MHRIEKESFDTANIFLQPSNIGEVVSSIYIESARQTILDMLYCRVKHGLESHAREAAQIHRSKCGEIVRLQFVGRRQLWIKEQRIIFGSSPKQPLKALLHRTFRINLGFYFEIAAKRLLVLPFQQDCRTHR